MYLAAKVNMISTKKGGSCLYFLEILELETLEMLAKPPDLNRISLDVDRKLKSCGVSNPGRSGLCVLSATPSPIHIGKFQNFWRFRRFVFFHNKWADFIGFLWKQVVKVLKQKMGCLFLVMDKVMKGWNIPGKLVQESFWGFCPFWVYWDFTCDTMKPTQNVEGIAKNDKLIHPLLYKFLGGSSIFDDLSCSKKSSKFTYVCFKKGWFNQLGVGIFWFPGLGCRDAIRRWWYPVIHYGTMKEHLGSQWNDYD